MKHLRPLRKTMENAVHSTQLCLKFVGAAHMDVEADDPVLGHVGRNDFRVAQGSLKTTMLEAISRWACVKSILWQFWREHPIASSTIQSFWT